MRKWHILITCEHGGNFVPPSYKKLFSAHTALLHSHRGYDIGALRIAQEIAKKLHAPCFAHKVTRLLVECNRSLHHPQLFSCVTCHCSREKKEVILEKYYYTYRNTIENWLAHKIERKEKVLHLSIHSFTPQLDGVIRSADIGVLFNPRRRQEAYFANELKRHLQRLSPWIVRKNYPYLGISDGFTTYLRTLFPENTYAGIEVEFNQKLDNLSPDLWKYRLLFPFIQSVDCMINTENSEV